MQIFKDWIINIIVIMIFVTILDAITPNARFKKYIDMVAGIIIIIAIISPVVNMIKGEDFLQKEVLSNTLGVKQEEITNDSTYVKAQEDVFVDRYKENMEETMKQWIGRRYDTDVERVSIEFDSDIKDTQRFGYINKVKVYLDDAKEDMTSKIIEDISSFYNVDKSNITIIG
jgi:stage III sporulation protein AF